MCVCEYGAKQGGQPNDEGFFWFRFHWKTFQKVSLALTHAMLNPKWSQLDGAWTNSWFSTTSTPRHARIPNSCKKKKHKLHIGRLMLKPSSLLDVLSHNKCSPRNPIVSLGFKLAFFRLRAGTSPCTICWPSNSTAWRFWRPGNGSPKAWGVGPLRLDGKPLNQTGLQTTN